jgi:hypothetical protein
MAKCSKNGYMEESTENKFMMHLIEMNLKEKQYTLKYLMAIFFSRWMIVNLCAQTSFFGMD